MLLVTSVFKCFQAYRDYYFSKRLVMKMEWPSLPPSWWSKRLAKVARAKTVESKSRLIGQVKIDAYYIQYQNQ